MKTTMLMLLSLIIAISLTENASSQLSFDCPDGYIQGDSVVVDTISCYQISIKYCYKMDDEENISLHFGNVSYYKLHEDCWESADFTAYLDEHYDELLEKHTKLILTDIIEKDGLDIVFCEEGSKKILNVSTAACASTTLVGYYVLRNEDGDLVPIYTRPKCAEDSYCLSTYQLCWSWDGVDVISEMRLIRRIADIYDTCPPSMIIDSPLVRESPLEVECRAICE